MTLCHCAPRQVAATSIFLCTCDPLSPRCVTVTPTLSAYLRNPNLHHQSAAAVAAYHPGQTMPMDVETDLHNAGGAQRLPERYSNEWTTQLQAELHAKISKKRAAAFVPSAPAGSAGAPVDATQQQQPSKRPRCHEDPYTGFANGQAVFATTADEHPELMADNAAVDLLALAPLYENAPLTVEQRTEFAALLGQSAGHGALTYGHVVDHFALRGIEVGSGVRAWLLHVLGQN